MVNTDPSLGLIVLTDSRCHVSGRSWRGIPTLVWPDGVDEAVSDWLRAQVVDYGVAVSSAHEYAKVIRPFRRYCRRRRMPWQSVDDEILISWREYLHQAMKVSVNRVNASLTTIFSFYRWAEENKYLRYRVGIYTDDELPVAIARTTFPISARRVFTKSRHGQVHGNWATPLTLSESRQTVHIRHTPTEDEIRKLHVAAVGRLHGERDSLMFSWAEEAGPRRAEILQVGKSHMPTMEQLDALIEHDEYWPVIVRRKGGLTQALNAPPDLVLRTLDYRDGGRRRIVEACRKTIVGYREPDEIFLSSRTGMPLHPDSVTAIGRQVFGAAGIARANIHRLRARFAVRTVETLVDAVFGDRMIGSESNWVETILVKAAEMMGHASPRSLRPYLTYVLNRRILNADGTKANALAARLRQLKLAEGTLVRRLQSQKDLQIVASHLQAGRRKDAASLLRRMADQLE